MSWHHPASEVPTLPPRQETSAARKQAPLPLPPAPESSFFLQHRKVWIRQKHSTNWPRETALSHPTVSFSTLLSLKPAFGTLSWLPRSLPLPLEPLHIPPYTLLLRAEDHTGTQRSRELDGVEGIAAPSVSSEVLPGQLRGAALVSNTCPRRRPAGPPLPGPPSRPPASWRLASRSDGLLEAQSRDPLLARLPPALPLPLPHSLLIDHGAAPGLFVPKYRASATLSSIRR